MDFDPVIEAYLGGRVVNVVPAASFDFRDGPAYLWSGRFNFDLGSKTWLGTKKIITVEGIEEAASLEASEMTFTISGADADMMAIASSSDRADYVRRQVIVYLIFFDENWQPLVEPYALKAGFMSDMQMSKQPVVGDGGQTTGWTRSITLPVTNLFSGRGVAPNSFWSDRDQQARSPGDTGMQMLVQLQNEQIPVPWR